MLIQLTYNKQAIIDDDNYQLVRGYSWQAYLYRHRWYAKTTYSIGGKSRRTLFLHRLILDAPPRKTVYHINGDGLDNRRSNLEIGPNGNKGRVIN